MFAYCGNDPASNIDTSGTMFERNAGGGGGGGLAYAGPASGHIVRPTTPTATIPGIPFIPLTSANNYKSALSEKILIKQQIKAKEREEYLVDVQTKTKQKKAPTHHIVAKADYRAAESRDILREVGIDPWTDPTNLVVLPQEYHVCIHTTAYHNYVRDRLRPVAGDRVGVELVLASLKAEILTMSALGTGW